MTKIKPILVLLLGTLFVGSILAYSFAQPFKPGAVYDAIPQGATFVYKADNLEELLNSPVSSQLDKALGDGYSFKEIADSNGWATLAASSEIAVADLPFRSAGRQKTWAAASWVGWRSPWLRWKLEGAVGEKLTFVGKQSVWPIWKYEDSEMANGLHLMFALTDNLLIACLSENPTDIITLLDTYDGKRPAHNQGK